MPRARRDRPSQVALGDDPDARLAIDTISELPPIDGGIRSPRSSIRTITLCPGWQVLAHVGRQDHAEEGVGPEPLALDDPIGAAGQAVVHASISAQAGDLAKAKMTRGRGPIGSTQASWGGR
jgi:hypothetical protein